MSQSPKISPMASDHADLPMLIIDHEEAQKSHAGTRTGFFSKIGSKLFAIPLVILVMFAGGVIGLYFQPPGLKAFFKTLGLQPGAGTSSPIAVPNLVGSEDEELKPVSKTVAGLGRLIPAGDVITVALPFGAGDARLKDVLVSVGDVVNKGDVIAVLDSIGQLQATLETARATVGVREASLNQTREQVRASIAEAEASLLRSQAAADIARQEFERAQSLFKRDVVSEAALDQAASVQTQADRDVERSAATLSRFTSDTIDKQVDVVVAARSLEAAKTEVRRAQGDLEKARVIAPIDGTVLDVHVRPGEKPGQAGVADIGNISEMTVEVEVFQNQIGLIELGQTAEVVADALTEPLRGVVSKIGLEVGRQTVSADDPAANTDARVVEVIVTLDKPSSALADRFTNLAVVTRINVGAQN
ncbi:MAG: HlyD family efflux transporter periplasmic adaptor subunit [Hyphomicrobiales bacterium]|uniref:HlyD family efflux transporter periplasmic adaptor subunit n=1 Tax=Nisaea sp. TaxID=2024842 RepID=UPI003269BB98